MAIDPARVPRAPKPATELRPSYGLPEPKASEVPHDPPIYFPRDLWAKTNLILLKAQRAFPLQRQTLELCKRVIADMAPLFTDAVKNGNIKADAVQTRDGGGMEDLLRLLLMCNDDGVKSGFGGLSDTAYHLGEQVRKSAEWFAMAEAIAEARQFKDAKRTQRAPKSAREKAVAIDHDLIERKIQHSPSGCVTNREAAVYFNVKPKTIRAWLNGRVQGKRLTAGVKRGTVSNDSILRLGKEPKASSEE